MATKKVLKYTLNHNGRTYIQLPAGAVVLTVKEQGPNICIWCLVDEKMPSVGRFFEMYGTGHDIEEYTKEGSLHYISTFYMNGATFVFHVFERVQ